MEKNHTPAKSPEDSSMTYEESENMSFLLSQVESLVKGFVSKGELEESMNSLKGDLEKSKEGRVKTLEEMMENKMKNTMGHMKDNIVESVITWIGSYGCVNYKPKVTLKPDFRI